MEKKDRLEAQGGRYYPLKVPSKRLQIRKATPQWDW